VTIVPVSDDGSTALAASTSGDVVAFDGTKYRHRFPSACLASQPPDDRTSTFDPLAGIETEPMNLPSGIATRGEIKPEGYRLVRGAYSFSCLARGEKVCRPRAMGGYTFFDEADLSTFYFSLLS